MRGHQGTREAGAGSRRRPAAALIALALALVAVGAWAAGESAAERPTVGLVAAWGCLFMILVLGLIAGRALARSGGWPGWAMGWVLGASAAAQLPLILAPPALSDDLHRYVHDGRVLAAGLDPYRHPPASPALDAVAGPERARVNHPHVRTAYPLLAEAGFAVAVMVGGGATLLKAGVACCGLLLSVLVAALLEPAARWRAIAVAWHPLLLLEGAGSGHVDVTAVTFLVGALWVLREPARRGLAAALLVAGAWVKLLPALAAAPLVRRLGRARAAAVLVLGLAAVVPPLWTSVPDGEQAGLAAYAEHWDFNGLVYPWLRTGVEEIELMRRLQVLTDRFAPSLSPWTGPQYATRALLGVAWLAALLLGAWRDRRPGAAASRAAFHAAAGFVLFTPTLHPWYLVWALPFVSLRASAAWLWLTGSAGLSYASALAAGGGAWEELAWPRALVQLPFAGLLLLELLRARRALDAGAPEGASSP